MTLQEIAIKHKTQKVPHGYMSIYDTFLTPLRYHPITLVEIGVADGASLKTWREYFTNINTRIIGLEKHLPSVLKFNDEFILNYQNVCAIHCDAGSEQDLDRVGEQFVADIIIDDGSHWAHEQLICFNKLWNRLKPGGLYVIEDLFTLYDPVWNPDPKRTIIDEIHNRMRNILIGGDSIQEVHWYGRNDINGIVLLRKRSEQFRIQPLEEFNL